MASSEKFIPNFLSGATLEYFSKCVNQVEENNRPDPKLYCNKHGRFHCFLHNKDSLILKKNRGLDEAHSDIVKDGVDIFQLREILGSCPLDLWNGHDSHT